MKLIGAFFKWLFEGVSSESEMDVAPEEADKVIEHLEKDILYYREGDSRGD